MYIYGTLLTANGSFKTLNILAALALVLNIGLNLWLIPIYKAYGAAISALVTQGFIGLSNLLFGIKILKVRFEPKFLSNIFISILFISGLMFMLIKLEMNWWQSSIAIGIGTMASMFGLKILDLRQGLELLKSRQSEKASL
jgi:O-antigen/teichoic acid export membrane protein